MILSTIKKFIKKEYISELILLCDPKDAFRKIYKFYLINEDLPYEKKNISLFRDMEHVINKYNEGSLDSKEIDRYEKAIPEWNWDYSKYTKSGETLTKLCKKIKGMSHGERSEYSLYRALKMRYENSQLSPHFTKLFKSIV